LAEDGIRDFHVTGVQTCALPICSFASTLASSSVFSASGLLQTLLKDGDYKLARQELVGICSVLLTANRCQEIVQKLEEKLKKEEIGRASCRERVERKWSIK